MEKLIIDSQDSYLKYKKYLDCNGLSNVSPLINSVNSNFYYIIFSPEYNGWVKSISIDVDTNNILVEYTWDCQHALKIKGLYLTGYILTLGRYILVKDDI